MGDISKAIYDVLAADSAVTSKLSTYGGLPAIFTGRLAPRGANAPFIVVSHNVGYIVRDSKTENVTEFIRDIRCYIPVDKSMKTLDELADAVRSAFHKQSYTVDNNQLILSRVIDIAGGPQEDDVSSLVVTVRIMACEN